MSDIFSNIQIPYATQTKSKENSTTNPTVQPVMVKNAIASSDVKDTSADSVEISTQNKEKKGPIKSIKGFIANVKKFFASTGEYIKGTAKGITSGVVAGSVVYTTGSIINYAKQKAANSAAKKAGEETAKIAKKIPNKALAFIAGGITLAANIWTASLNATEAGSKIDHRWTGHQQ